MPNLYYDISFISLAQESVGFGSFVWAPPQQVITPTYRVPFVRSMSFNLTFKLGSADYVFDVLNTNKKAMLSLTYPTTERLGVAECRA